MTRFKTILLILTPFAVILILLVVFSLFSKEQKPQTPFLSPTLVPNLPPKNSSSFYQPQSGKKMAEKLDKREPISQTEQTIRKKLITTALSNQQIVHKNSLFIVYYSKAFDVFQVEINTTEIANAKQQTVQWFKNQGFSQNGICNLPIMFILNSDVKIKLQGQNIKFSYLPEGC